MIDINLSDLDEIKTIDNKIKYRIIPLILINKENDNSVFIYPSLFSRFCNLLIYGTDYEDFDLYSHLKGYILLRILFPDRKFSYKVLQYIAFVLYHNHVVVCPYNFKKFFPLLMNIFLITTDNDTYHFIYEINKYYQKKYPNLSNEEINKIKEKIPSIIFTLNLEKFIKKEIEKIKKIKTLRDLVDYLTLLKDNVIKSN
jgi:hypothetical protein